MKRSNCKSFAVAPRTRGFVAEVRPTTQSVEVKNFGNSATKQKIRSSQKLTEGRSRLTQPLDASMHLTGLHCYCFLLYSCFFVFVRQTKQQLCFLFLCPLFFFFFFAYSWAHCLKVVPYRFLPPLFQRPPGGAAARSFEQAFLLLEAKKKVDRKKARACRVAFCLSGQLLFDVWCWIGVGHRKPIIGISKFHWNLKWMSSEFRVLANRKGISEKIHQSLQHGKTVDQ